MAATPATPGYDDDGFEDDFEPATPVVAAAPAPAPVAAEPQPEPLVAAAAVAEALPRVGAAPPTEAAVVPAEAAPPAEAARAAEGLVEAAEDHAQHLANLRHRHGAHFLLRIRQFLSIARADRAGTDPRDDAGDPGLLGPSRGQGPQHSLAKSEPCLEALAGLWRTFEGEFEDDRTASLDVQTARWSPAHEHQFLLFRSGCRADPGRSSLKAMSRHKKAGLGARDPSHSASVAAKPLNLMTNFLTARVDIIGELDGRAFRATAKTNADAENFVDAVLELLAGRRRREVDDFDETEDDCRVVARVARAATFCARLSHAVRLNARKRFADVHDLFGKRARLRPKATSQEAETTYTFPELLLGTALLNVPFSIWEARDFFAAVGGKVGEVADLGALEGIFVAFWLEVCARRGGNHRDDYGPASPSDGATKDPELRRFRTARDAVAAAAAELHLTWERTAEINDEGTEPSRPRAPGYKGSEAFRLEPKYGPLASMPRKPKQPELEVKSNADYAQNTRGLVKAEHLLHRRHLLAQKYIDLRAAFSRRAVHHARPSTSGLTRPQKNLRDSFAVKTSPLRPRTADTGALRRRRDLAAALRRNERAEVTQRDFGAEAKARRRKRAEDRSREISRTLARAMEQRKALQDAAAPPKTPLASWIPEASATSVPVRYRPSSAPAGQRRGPGAPAPPWNKRVPQSAHKIQVVEKPRRRRRKVKGAPKDRSSTHGWRAKAPKAKDPAPVLPACLFPMSTRNGALPGLYGEPASQFKMLV